MKGALKEKDRTLDLITQCYRDYLGENLVSLVLFGSRARGDYKEGSDYDLLIITKSLPESRMERIMFIRKPISEEIAQRVSIIVKTKEEFLSSFPSLYLDIALDGIILYDREFIGERLEKIRKIIQEAGLTRILKGEESYWRWNRPPKRGWEITWEGYREL